MKIKIKIFFLLSFFTLSILVIGCDGTCKNEKEDYDLTIEIKYFDNSKDTIFVNDCRSLSLSGDGALKGFVSAGRIWVARNVATQVKTYKILEKK